MSNSIAVPRIVSKWIVRNRYGLLETTDKLKKYNHKFFRTREQAATFLRRVRRLMRAARREDMRELRQDLGFVPFRFRNPLGEPPETIMEVVSRSLDICKSCDERQAKYSCDICGDRICIPCRESGVCAECATGDAEDDLSAYQAYQENVAMPQVKP